MTRAELIARIRLQLFNDAYYTDQNLTDSIQDGLDEIVAFSGLNITAASIPFKGNLTYYDFQSLLPNFLAVYAIFNRTTKMWMYPTNIRKLDRERIDWETCQGTPEVFVPVSYRYTAIYKKPVVEGYGDMWVFYIGTADTINNETSLIPDTIRTDLIESYVYMDLYEQGQEWTKAGAFFNNYETLLLELRTWIQTGRIPDRLLQIQG